MTVLPDTPTAGLSEADFDAQVQTMAAKAESLRQDVTRLHQRLQGTATHAFNFTLERHRNAQLQRIAEHAGAIAALTPATAAQLARVSVWNQHQRDAHLLATMGTVS